MPSTISPDPPSLEPARLLPGAERACALIRRSAVIVALLLGGSNLAVWVCAPARAIAVQYSISVMRMNTAVAITLAAISLALWGASSQPWKARTASAFAFIVTLIGGLTALQDIFDVDLGIDELLAPGAYPGDGAGPLVVRAGRMSLNAALSLFFLGLSLICIEWCASWRIRKFCPAPGLALVSALPPTLAFVGYLLGVPAFTGPLRSTNILLHTALALFLLSAGVLAARPSRVPICRILSTGADGVLLRWTLPGTAALLLTLGWLITLARANGYVAPGQGTALMLYGGLVLLSILLLAVSQAVARQEARARLASAALRRGEERSRAILDTAIDAVVLMDAEGEIADWNPAAERIFGWSRDEVMGQSLAKIIIPERFREAHYRGLKNYLATHEGSVLGQRLELSALRREGSEFPVELSINPLPGAGRILFVGFVRDITDRQAVEAKLRSAKEAAELASRAKDNFLATLSHELRTPLAPVLMSASTLREDPRLSQELRDQMAMIERNIGLEARLIDDLLDLTRITRGKLALRSERCDAHSLIWHAVETVREEARAKGQEVELQLAARCAGLMGDAARLQQVFWNLLKNAVKFTPAGGRIVIRTRDSETAAGHLILEVSDTGLGFTTEAAEHIFQPFEQADRGGDHRFGGLGLGLSIARAIVDLHGGVIRAGSEGPGRGATFTVELPGAVEPPHGIAAEGSAALPLGEEASLRLLLVEDHEPTLAVLQRLLVRAGHEVTAVSSVTDALAVAEAGGFDAVISDLGLPDGSGLELMARLRERHPGLPGIALSGYGMEDDLQRSREAGFAMHLVKPVDFQQVRHALRSLKVTKG